MYKDLKWNISLSTGETPMGAFQMMMQVWVIIHLLGKYGNLKGWLFLGLRRGSQTLKGSTYLGLGGMWHKNAFVGLLLSSTHGVPLSPSDQSSSIFNGHTLKKLHISSVMVYVHLTFRMLEYIKGSPFARSRNLEISHPFSISKFARFRIARFRDFEISFQSICTTLSVSFSFN